MTIEKHEKAIELKQRIKHIDLVIKFLTDNLKKTTNPDGNLHIRQCGFIAHPEFVTITKAEIEVILNALKKEKTRLITEFNLL